MADAIPPLLLLGGHGSTSEARAAIETALREALGPAVTIHSIGGQVVMADGVAWWDDELAAEDLPGLVAGLDGAARGLGLAGGPVVAVGFSQGGAAVLAWACSPGRRQRLAGAACVAGFLPGCVAGALPARAVGVPPVLVVITEDDEVVDPFLGGVAVRTLRKAGVAVESVPVDAAHEWTDEATEAVVAWALDLHR